MFDQPGRIVLLSGLSSSRYHKMIQRLPTQPYGRKRFFAALLRSSSSLFFFALLLRSSSSLFVFALLLRSSSSLFFFALLPPSGDANRRGMRTEGGCEPKGDANQSSDEKRSSDTTGCEPKGEEGRRDANRRDSCLFSASVESSEKKRSREKRGSDKNNTYGLK